MNRKVVITGMGLLSPIGNSVSEFYSNLKNSTNGIDLITQFDTSNHSVHIAGEVKIDLEDYIENSYLESNEIQRTLYESLSYNNLQSNTTQENTKQKLHQTSFVLVLELLLNVWILHLHQMYHQS